MAHKRHSCERLIGAAIALGNLTLCPTALFADEKPPQEILLVPVRVVDAENAPIAGVEVIPWALRCSQGHGKWRVGGLGDSEPEAVTTDADGRATIAYPRYAEPKEYVSTTEVTLSLNHPDFAYISHEDVNVPREDDGPHTVTLPRGAVVEIVPIEEGKPAKLEGLYVKWSDGRSWVAGIGPKITDDVALRIPPMPAGKGKLLMARLDGERVTHFSPVVDLELQTDTTVRERVELSPAVRIKGSFSANVPRPVANGRVSLRMLPKESGFTDVNWYDWTPVAEDGTFEIDSWPAGEALQVIAICDGFIAESGEAPEVVQDPPKIDSFQRPQVFSSEALGEPIEVRMTPMVRCAIETVNESGAPVAGVKVGSCPNVGWWNGGSQIYCTPLVRGAQLLVKRDYSTCIDTAFPTPFITTTDANGRGELELPAGREDLYVEHAEYELPVVRGRRDHRVLLDSSKSTTIQLRLQPKGNEFLGEWDKLAGVLFGCTGEECRRLLDDAGFRTNMDEVRKLLDSADDPTDPAVLSSAYTATAAAFDELDDKEEASKWRLKAAQQAEKLKAKSRDTSEPKP
ncbi:MAG: Ig-like domain-containing protein [Pirellulales bacterium]